MLWFNGLSAIAWLILTVVQNLTTWSQSVAYVSNLSTWALFAASLSGFVASRVEVAQDEADIATEVVAKMVTDTVINPAEAP